jgi:hypothetical protein
MKSIRLDVEAGSGSGATGNAAGYICDSVLQIVVNGTALPSIPLGLALSTYNFSTPCGSGTPVLGSTPRYSCTTANASNLTVGCEIDINIPYTTSLQINYIPDSAEAGGSCIIYSNVDYYSGAAPPGLYPATDGSFHLAVIPCCSATLTQYSTGTLLSTVSAYGRVFWIAMFIYSTTDISPYYLEGPLTVTLDGVPWAYNGTEDAFCGSFYFASSAGYFHGPDSCGAPNITPFNSVGSANVMFRFFDANPLVFHSSGSVTWINGMSGTAAPGSVVYSALVGYYTQP